MICRILQLKCRNPRVKVYTEDQLVQIKQSTDPTPRFSVQTEDQFSMIVLRIRTKLDRISSTPEQIQDLRNRYSKSIKQAQQKQNSDQLDTIIEQNRLLYGDIKKDLEQLNNLLDYEDKEEPQYNMKKNVFIALNGQLATVIAEQKEQVQHFRLCVRDKVGRQVKLIDHELNQQQVQYYVDHPQQAQKMLENKIYGQASNNLKNAVSDIQDKLKDIQKLQKSVGRCLELFKQLQLLIFAQGQIIDNIQKNVNEAKDYIDRSVDVLIVAKKTHKSIKKKMYIIFCIVFVILLVIIIPIAVKKK